MTNALRKVLITDEDGWQESAWCVDLGPEGNGRRIEMRNTTLAGPRWGDTLLAVDRNGRLSFDVTKDAVLARLIPGACGSGLG